MIGPLHVTAPPHRKMMIGLAVVGGVLAVPPLGGVLFALLGTRDKEFLLGMSGPLKGPSKELGREMEIGIKTYIRHLNDEGGGRRRKLRLAALDDGHETAMDL